MCFVWCKTISLLRFLHPCTIGLPAAQVVRQGGLRSTLLYNLVGGGHWDVLVMNALVGMGPGGTPISLSLMQQAPPNAAAASPAAVSHAEALAAAHQARLLAAEQHAADAVAARQSTRREQ